jgi:hexosaminidase
MDVIPFVNFYGHLHELLRNQKYSHLGMSPFGNDLDPRKQEVQTMLKDWMTQYAQMFPSPFIHIGFDETWETQRQSERNPQIHPEQLYTDHLAFVAKELQQHGKTVMVWTDISKNHPGIIAKFPKQVIPVVWDYSDKIASIETWIEPIEKAKLPFFIQPAVDGWAHLYPTETTWGNIDLCLEAANEHKAMGYITSVWTDAVQPMLRNSWMFMAYGAVVSWQNKPIERIEFIDLYTRATYPAIAEQMSKGLKMLSESQVYLRKPLGQTQTRMWLNPFKRVNLEKTEKHIEDFEKSRLAAELAQEYFMDALSHAGPDSTFVKSMILNSRLLAYTAMRFLWGKKITDRWNYTMLKKGKKDGPWYNDIGENSHGLVMDMLDYTTEIKEEYRQSWLSENTSYRLGNMSGRFDDEYNFWRTLSGKMRHYQDNHEAGDEPVRFEKVFDLE